MCSPGVARGTERISSVWPTETDGKARVLTFAIHTCSWKHLLAFLTVRKPVLMIAVLSLFVGGNIALPSQPCVSKLCFKPCSLLFIHRNHILHVFSCPWEALSVCISNPAPTATSCHRHAKGPPFDGHDLGLMFPSPRPSPCVQTCERQ
ncbi:unnamed protein product [Scytosiphon promiscuus]